MATALPKQKVESRTDSGWMTVLNERRSSAMATRLPSSRAEMQQPNPQSLSQGYGDVNSILWLAYDTGKCGAYFGINST
jgi:hypothetical protein